MRNNDRQRPPLPTRLTPAERDFYLELRRLVDAAGLSFRALEESTSTTKSDSGESSFYSKSQWGRWLNGQSLPPRKAVRRLAEKLAGEDIEAEHLIDLWGRAFVPTSYPQEPGVALIRPRQLPVTPQHFIGRTTQLDTLTRMVAQGTESTGAIVIVIEGTAGVGKTTLANQFGHIICDRFPDGQLYVNMRGFDVTGRPMTDSEALRGFLDTLGVSQEASSAALDDQAALYRSVLADRRVLVILDNASDAAQVRRLLPGAPGCLVLVTSRNQLHGLAAEGAQVLRLDPFTMEEARDMLSRRLGSGRVLAEPQAAEELIGLWARLPLALSVGAAYAAAHPGFSLAAIASEFRSRGLDLLDTGDAATTARTVFAQSYHHLSEDAARMFRLLGVHPGPDIGLPAAASLAAVPVDQARKALDELARAYLAVEHQPGRFTFHDLLRAYAAEQARIHENADDLEEAVRRLLDYYLRAMNAGELLMYRPRVRVELPEPVPGSLAENFSTHEQALTFCRTERHVVQALVTNAAERGGFDAYCWQIPRAMAPLLARHSLFHDYLAIQRIAVEAAHNLGDLLGLGHAHYEFAHACALLGEVADSATHLEQALKHFAAVGDQGAQAMAQNGLSQLLEQQGRYAQALEHEKKALRLRHKLGDGTEIAHSEQTIGSIYARLGQYDAALRHCRRALDYSRETGNLLQTADTLDILGRIHLGLGDHDEAVACYLQALAIYREVGDEWNEPTLLIGLGDAQLAANDASAARDSWQEALTLLEGLPNADDQPVRARLAQLG